MNLSHQEKVLIKDIFNARVANQPGDGMLLVNFPKEIATLGPNISLMDHTAYFDSLIMEILQFPNTNILAYLEESLIKANYIQEKPWNQTQLAQKFINYSKEIINNFIYLSQTLYELFPDQLEIQPEASKTNDPTLAAAQRIMTHFERKGFNMLIIEAIYPKINEELNTKFQIVFLNLLILKARCQTIIDSKAYFYLTLLQELMSIPEFKKAFFNLPNIPILPVQFSKITAPMIDTKSPLGVLMRYSILGTLPGYLPLQMEAHKRFDEKTMMEFGKEKFGKDKMKYYADLQKQFYTKCTDLYKIFLKKETQKPFFQWNYAVIESNIPRTKLGHRLATAKQNIVSHDGLMVNLYMSFLNLCLPILKIENEKYKNINPEYFIYKERVQRCKYEPLNNKKTPKVPPKNVEFGTISEFFFLALEFLHVGVIPAFENFVQNYEAKERLEKLANKFPPGHHLYSQYCYEIEKSRTKNILYYFVLMDQTLIKPTIKLFELLLHMLPQWLKIDYYDLNNCKFENKYEIPQLAYFIPEHVLNSIYKFHLEVYKFKKDYIIMLGEKHIHNILNLVCLVLSDEDICSNPYMGANFVQLLFFFVYERKTGIMYEIFKSNPVAHRNLVLSLIKFYSDIAVTGSANAFYEKFKYRSYVNKIFTSIWAHEVYRDNMKTYFKTQTFQRFLNMVMSDTTYCFDETNEKYDSYKELQRKSELGQLNEEDKKNQEQLSGQIQATLNHSTSNLKLIRELSKWSPETFFSEAFLNDTVLLLNHILKTFMDPTSFVSNRQLLLRYKFEREAMLSNIVQIYVNLNISQKFPSEIVKDTRFFQKDYFNKALQKASNEHQTDIETLEKFEDLINSLQASMDDEEDDEIFGEIPDKYLCCLMSTLLKEPVKLPSGYIVDRVYIHKHVLNDERDPFTRAPLKNGDWIQMKELKDQIMVWKKKRLQELKGGNKQLKYGKIGKNAKQEQIDSLFDGKKVNYEGEDQQEMMEDSG